MMKKSILFVLMIIFVSTNLYAEELHYHNEMWCLKPDGTPNGIAAVMEDGSISIFHDEVGFSTDRYIKESLQTVYEEYAIDYGIPTQIPSKRIEYDIEENSGTVIVNPISATQIYIFIMQHGSYTYILMTYDPFTKTTRYTACTPVPHNFEF